MVLSVREQVNAGLSERRAKIEELHTVRSLLTKLQFLTDLPAYIQKCTKVSAAQRGRNTVWNELGSAVYRMGTGYKPCRHITRRRHTSTSMHPSTLHLLKCSNK